MKWITARRVLAVSLLAMSLASIGGCYPYWRDRDWGYRRDGSYRYGTYDRYDGQRDYDGYR